MKVSLPVSLRGLTTQLILFIVLPLTTLLLVVTFGGVALHQNAMRDLVGERDQRAVQAAASSLSEQLHQRLQALDGLARQAQPGASAQELQEQLAASALLMPQFDNGLALTDSAGSLLAFTGSPEVWAAFEQQAAAQLQTVFASASPSAAVSPVYWLGGQPVMFAAAPNSGRVAVGAFSPTALVNRTLQQGIGVQAGGEVFLVDQNRQVIYSSGDSLEGEKIANHPGVTEGLSGRSGTAFLHDTNPEHVVAYSPVEPAMWALVIEEPWENVMSPWLRLTLSAPLVLIPGVILAVLALWFGTRRVVEPLQALEARAARLGWGDYAAIEEPVGGIGEIRHLQGELAHLAHKVQAAQQGLRDYIGAMTAGQEEERRRLARELHDDTLQSLIALNQRIQLIQLELERQPALSPGVSDTDSPHSLGAISKEVDELQTLADESIRNLRRVTRALRPIYLEDLGLVTALEMLAREVSQPGLKVEFRLTGQARRLDPQVELALYRMAQEALSNVTRHSQAAQAEVGVNFGDTLGDAHMEIDVSDNGRGFVVPESPAAFAPSGHFGLLGLYERAEMIGARLKIESQPGAGARVSIRLPLEEGEQK